MAQSYTAGISGTLQGVAIDVTALDVTQVARIQIEAIVGGIPSNVVLGTARAAKGGDKAGTMFSTFDNGATWQSYASEGDDLHFQTFVIPN